MLGVPKWVWVGLLLPLVVLVAMPGTRDYIQWADPVPVNDEAILKLRIEEAAGGTVTDVGFLADGKVVISYLLDLSVDDTGEELGRVMSGIAQAVRAEGLEFEQVTLFYGPYSAAIVSNNVIVNVATILAFIDGEMDEAKFNNWMMRSPDVPVIVRPG